MSKKGDTEGQLWVRIRAAIITLTEPMVRRKARRAAARTGRSGDAPAFRCAEGPGVDLPQCRLRFRRTINQHV